MPSLEEYEQLFVEMGRAENEARQAAESIYQTLKSNQNEFVLAHCQLLSASSKIAVRSLAAVLLRRHVSETSLNKVLSGEVISMLKVFLLQAVDNEVDNSVRHKICDVVSEVGAEFVNLNLWEELLPKMFQWASSSNANYREASLKIFASLVQVFVTPPEVPQGQQPQPSRLHRYFAVVLDLFSRALKDSDEKVRVAGLMACTSFLVTISPESGERQNFQPLLADMLAVIGTAIQNSNEESARLAIEQFIEIAEEEPKFLKPQLPRVINGMMHIIRDQNLDEETRHAANEFLIVLCECAPAMMRKQQGFVAGLIPLQFQMMTDLGSDSAEELASWNTGDEDENKESANEDTGSQALDRLALSLGPKTVLPIANEQLSVLIQSDNWRYRHAALMGISVIGEGCKKLMQNQLQAIVPTVLRYFQDPHPRVRWAACNAIGMMAVDFPETFQKNYHSLVIPQIVILMDDSGNPRVQSHAAAALINFSENAEQSEISPYVDVLLTKLLLLLQNGTIIVQEQAITAIASVADCVEDIFSKYYGVIMPILKNILIGANTKELRIMRGKALECISLIGIAVGKEIFINDARDVLNAMIHTQNEKMDDDDPQQSYLLQAWARICRVLGRDFIPFLDVALPPLIASVARKPDVCVVDAEEGQLEKLDTQGYDTRQWGDKIVGIKTALLEEKATACHMLCCYIDDLKEGFFPWIGKVLDLLIGLLTFFYNEDVRHAAASAMPDLLQSCVSAIQNQMATQDHLNEMVAKIFPALSKAIKGEPELEILEIMVECLDLSLKTIRDCPLPIEILEDIIEQMKYVYVGVMAREKIRSEQYHKDEDFDEEEKEINDEEEKLDQFVLAQISDVYCDLLRHQTANFLPRFGELFQLFVELAQPNRKTNERQAAICVFCEFIENGGSTAQAEYNHMIPVIINSLFDREHVVRQAAIYGAGAFAEFGGEYFQSCAAAVTEKLVTLVKDNNSRSELAIERATDNAVASLWKVIEFQGNTVDAKSIVNLCLNYMPMKIDLGEAKLVCLRIIKLLESNNQFVLQNNANIPIIVQGLVSTASIGILAKDKDLNDKLVQILRSIPVDMLQQLAQSYPEDVRQHLSNILTASSSSATTSTAK